MKREKHWDFHDKMGWKKIEEWLHYKENKMTIEQEREKNEKGIKSKLKMVVAL